MYFMAGGNLKFVFGATAAALVFIVITIASSEYRMSRVTTYLDPTRDPLGAGFHIRQITLALGRGGLLGQGIGNSQQKLAYIPEPSSDSIFAITAEELGFIGSVCMISIYFTYMYGAMQIAKAQKKESFRFLLAVGILIWFSTQTLLNLAAIVALVPLTGVPLPLFSYGGSSMVMILFATGILLRLAYKK
jgi:cell division protein FtsW